MMGKLEEQAEFKFGQVTYLLYLDKGEATENGYVVELMAESLGLTDTIGHWSFGYEKWSRQIWNDWYRVLKARLQFISEQSRIEQNELLKDFHGDFLSLNCTYEDYVDYADRTGSHLQELKIIENYIKLFFGAEESQPENRHRIIITMDGGLIQEIISNTNLDVFVIDYDSEGADVGDVFPIHDTEAYISERDVYLSAKRVEEHLNEIAKAITLKEEREKIADEEKALSPYIGAAYMIPLEDGLTAGEIKELLTYLPEDVEMVPIEIYQNNTAIIGFQNAAFHTATTKLKAIANDWSLQPVDNVVVTESGNRIILLERVLGGVR